MKKGFISFVLAAALAVSFAAGLCVNASAVYTLISVGDPPYVDIEKFSEGLAAVCVKDGDTRLYGFIDEAVNEVIPCKYTKVQSFSNGLAAVQAEGKWSFIDRNGEKAIPAEYDAVESFAAGFACVCLNGKWGMIDMAGTEIIPCKYDSVSNFRDDGFAIINLNGKRGLADKTGKVVVPCKYDEIWESFDNFVRVRQQFRWGLVDKTGKEIVPCKYVELTCFGKDLLRVCLNEKYGLLDKTGKEVVPCKYGCILGSVYATADGVEDFRDGLALVYLSDKDGNRKYGYIDKTGREVIPCKYDGTNGFSEGLAAVYLNGKNYYPKYGFIDKTGKVVIPCKYDDANDFSEGLASVCLNGKYGFIDKTGKVVIPFKYSSAASFEDGFAHVSAGNNAFYIDKTGKKTVRYFPCPELYADEKDIPEDVIVACDGNDKYGFINRKSGKAVTSFKYTLMHPFSEGLAMVKVPDPSGRESYAGFVDKTGKEVIPCEYQYARDFHDGLAVIEKYGWPGLGYIDKTGKEVVPVQYTAANDFYNGIACVGDGAGNIFYGFIDKTGKEIIPCDYPDVWWLNDGLLMMERSFRYTIFNAAGTEVLPFRCSYAKCYTENLLVAWKDVEGQKERVPKLFWIAETGAPAPIAYASAQSVLVDDSRVDFQCYALKDADGGITNYIKLRDVAYMLNGTAAQFNVGWNGNVNMETGKPYAPNGSEMQTPFSGNRIYKRSAAVNNVNGKAADLSAIILYDDKGNGYTYYKLRDLGAALGFNVDWSATAGISIQTK